VACHQQLQLARLFCHLGSKNLIMWLFPLQFWWQQGINYLFIYAIKNLFMFMLEGLLFA
jgi:hypothetical protein